MNRITFSMLMGVVTLLATGIASTASATCFEPCGAVLCRHPFPLVGIGEGLIVGDASTGRSVHMEQIHWSDEEGLSGQLVPVSGAFVLGQPTRVLAFLVRQEEYLFVSEVLPMEGTTVVCMNPHEKLSVNSAVDMATSNTCEKMAESKGLYPMECNDTSSSISCSAAGTSHGVLAFLVSALALALGLGGRKRRRSPV